MTQDDTAGDGRGANGSTEKPLALLLLCAGLVALADFLFWGRPAGWTVGLNRASAPRQVVGSP